MQSLLTGSLFDRFIDLGKKYIHKNRRWIVANLVGYISRNGTERNKSHGTPEV